MLRAARRQHPAILPWFLVLGWRPSFRFGHGHLARFAQRAGLLLDLGVWRDPSGKPFPLFLDLARMTRQLLPRALRITGSDEPGKKTGFRSIMQKRAPNHTRTLLKAQRRMLCFSSSAW